MPFRTFREYCYFYYKMKLTVQSLLLSASVAIGSANASTITDLGAVTGFGDVITHANAINASGQVAGTTGQFPFSYSSGSLNVLNGYPQGQAVGINAGGSMVGAAPSSSGGFSHAVVYSPGGGAIDLGTIDSCYGCSSFGYGINDSGSVVGASTTSGGATHAFVYASGIMTDIGTSLSGDSAASAINNAGDIAGYSLYGHAFLDVNGAVNGAFTDLGTLGGTRSEALALNSSDQVAGDAYTAGGEDHAFLYSQGAMTDLGTMGTGSSQAFGINSQGVVVGQFGGTTAFVYANGVMIDLNSLLPANSGWTLTSAQGINDAGQIVGFGSSADGAARAFLLDTGTLLTGTLFTGTATPEPGSLTLVALGAAIMGCAHIGCAAHRRSPKA